MKKTAYKKVAPELSRKCFIDASYLLRYEAYMRHL
jgi:hypothetical protein